MLRNMNDLIGCAIEASDGTIGHVTDFYFDDKAWVIRYLVVEAGSWLSSRKVLVSPAAVTQPDWEARSLRVALTKEQVRSSPDTDTDKPVSRQHEMQYLTYYHYPYYWGGVGRVPEDTGLPARPDSARVAYELANVLQEAKTCVGDDHKLRSRNEVMGYHIHAIDGDMGHVQGLLVDERTWAILYIVVDTSNWWLGHQALVVPKWIRQVNWSASQVLVDLTRQAIREAPTYDPRALFDREREMDLYKHYGRPGYWAG